MGIYLPMTGWQVRIKFGSVRYLLPDEQVNRWLRGSDYPGYTSRKFSMRQVILVSDNRGRYLGLAKILKDRLKNLLPRRLAGGWGTYR